MGTMVKAPIGVEDVNFKDSGTTRQTFTRTDSTGRTLTLNKPDGADIQFRTVAKSIDDLVDGGYDVTLKVPKIAGGVLNTNGHTVPNVADDIFVLRGTTETISGVKTFTGTIKGGKGADVASEAALFNAAGFPTDGNYFDITGTTTITSITTSGQVGTVIHLQFDGALTLTYHATDLVLPNGVNIVTVAGDVYSFIEYASGDWRLIGGASAYPAFSVHKNATNQTGVVTGTATKVTWSTELFDTNNDFASDKFTPTVAGKYLLSAVVFWTVGVDNSDMLVTIYKNGTAFQKGPVLQMAGTANQGPLVAAIVDANGTTDYFELYAQQDTGADKIIDGEITSTWFSGCKIA